MICNGGNLNEVLIHLKDAGTCIIKPSIASSSSNGIIKVAFQNGIDILSGKSIEEILKSMGRNYVVEKPVEENDNLSRLNPSSCNTLRVHTYRDVESGEIKYISSFLRIGRKGSFVDNGGKGGICVSIDDNGRLVGDTAWTSKTWDKISHTDTGIPIDGYQIEQFDDIIKTACKAHQGIYHFDFIGWNIAVDKDNNVVIIEYNPDPDMRLDQVWFKDTCLGHLQPEILKAINSK